MMFVTLPAANEFVQNLQQKDLKLNGLVNERQASSICDLIRGDGDVFESLTLIAHVRFSGKPRLEVLTCYEATHGLPSKLRMTFGNQADDIARHVVDVIAGPAPK